MVERAGVIQASQRARGLDTEGSVRARLRGVLPLVGPVILSSLTEVEERSLALEVRAFGRPGRRHLLWQIPDSRGQLVVRARLLLALVAARSSAGSPAPSRRLPDGPMLELEGAPYRYAGLRQRRCSTRST